MLVLGFNGGFKRAEDDDIWASVRHDSSAVLMRDGEILAAIEEERLNRVKHTNCFPRCAIAFCLEHLQEGWDEIDFITTSTDANDLTTWAQSEALHNMTSPVPNDASEFVASLLQRDFGTNLRSKLRFVEHHDAHLWSAYAFSGFQDALVFSIDGAGDGHSGRICIGTSNSLTSLRDFSVSQSLGHFYNRVIRLIGFSYFDEYKAMGLAPYGDPRTFKALFQEGYSLLEEGDYEIDSDLNWTTRFLKAGLLASARAKGSPFQQVHMDVAAAVQFAIEDIATHVLRYYSKLTGAKNLCLAGGVAHNCSLNGKILKSGMFDRMFVQPAAHDAGTALGACCATILKECPSTRMKPMRDAFLGSKANDSAVLEELELWKEFVRIEFVNNAIEYTAALLAEGAVIGRVHGRSEFGPRSLGNRSILADSRPASHKDLINMMVKKREQFRPFAPAVLAERAQDCFDIPRCEADLSYMTYVVDVQPHWRHRLCAVTHVDGTARLQVVSRETNPSFWDLLKAFERLTGTPILLNTSFNNNAEPIVESVRDAIACFLTTGINYLVIENHVLTKRSPDISYELFVSMVLRVPETRRVVVQNVSSGTSYFIESTKGSLERRPRADLSFQVYSILRASDSMSSIACLLDSCRIESADERNSVAHDLLELWSARFICLRPQA